MIKNIFVIVFIGLFLISCQSGTEDAKKFSDEFGKVTEKLIESRSKVKTRDQFAAFKEERKEVFENLLKKFEKSPAIEKIEILRSKALLKLEKLDEAEKKIDNLLAEKPDLIDEAKMVKVLILLEREKFSEAYDIFKDIEANIKDVNDLFDTYYKLAMGHQNNKIKEEYAKKFLDSPQIPEHYTGKNYEMYFMLASVEKEEGNFAKAKEYLKTGVSKLDDKNKIAFLEKCLGQFDLIGKKALPILAGTGATWLNSSPLQLQGLKGKVVVVEFWAPWCPSCRKTVPALVDVYNELKDQEFVLIGSTRLYGRYRDDIVDKGKVNKDEELENIKNFLVRNKISYPIAVMEDKTITNTYKIPAIPALVFINKKGDIDFIKIGGGDQFIKNRIKKLLAES